MLTLKISDRTIENLKTAAIWAVIVVLTLCLAPVAHGQQTVAPFYTSQANTSIYVNMGAGSPYATIAKATTKACSSPANFLVVILPGANPTDSIGGQTGVCNGVLLIDYTSAPAATYKGNGTIYVAQGGGGGCTGPCVTTFNGRNGSVTLTEPDIAGAIGGSPATGQVPTWNGSAYVPATPAAGGVSSFNTRTGAITLSAPDVATAIGSQTGCSTAGFVWVPQSNTCVAQTGGGFPFTLGSTPIAAGSTVDSVTGLTVNGVNLQHGGSSTAYLNQAGGYSGAGGASVAIKFMSVQGCPQDADPNAGGGADATACINALFAAATPTATVAVVQDKGFSTVSGNGILCPAAGNCILAGEGGGIARTLITNCSISGGVAILTAVNTLTAGQTGTISQMTHCPSLNNTTVTVLSTGLSSTQFEVAAGGAVAGGAEAAGLFTQAYGTGFFLASGSRDLFSNGPWGSGSSCDVGSSAPPSRGANVQVTNLVLNGNAPNQTNYCFGVDLNNLEGITIRDVVFYNASKYSLKLSNVGKVTLDSNTYFSTTAPTGTNTDGVHVEGPANDISISNSRFHTSDDAIALNSIEGNCGPIARVAMSNNTFDQSFTALRMYNENLNSCSNGLVPLISYIDMNNNSGTVATHPFEFGLGAPPYLVGTLNPAIDHVHISNSTFNSPAVDGANAPFNIEENIGDLTVSNFTLVSPSFANAYLMSFGAAGTPCSLGRQYAAHVSLSNVTIVNTSAGSTFSSLLGDSGCETFGTFTVDGFATEWQGVTPTAQGPLFYPLSGTSTMGNLMATNVDPTNLAFFPNGSAWNTWGYSNIFAMIPNGIVTTPVVGTGTPTTNYNNSGLPGLAGPGDGPCNFSGAISPYLCGATYWNGAVLGIPLEHP